MIRPQRRLGIIRERVCNARQLVRRLHVDPLSPDSVRTHLQVRLAVALQALARLKTMPMLRGSSECELLVDRVKALLELDVPILLLSSIAPKDRIRLGAELLESLRFDETSGCSLNQLIAIGFPPANSSSRFAAGAFLDLVAWFDAVVAATIEADRAGESAGQRGRWFEGNS